MRVIIAGGRDFNVAAPRSMPLSRRADSRSPKFLAAGRAVPMHSAKHGRAITAYRCVDSLPNWKRYKRRAGVIRNAEMARNADALVALPGGRGTADMIRRARQHGLTLYIAKAA